ncbi:MAG: IS110 family transposase, partial [Clostridiales Family XIII bacterium]|nr:IS110 family transposase [Clostridiales Family XIII bacterium]
MKIIHPICCGVDVHKRTIVATIATTDKNNITSYSVRTFSALNADLYAFRDWLLENRCQNSMTVSNIGLANILCDSF